MAAALAPATTALLAVPLLATVFSPRRWRRRADGGPTGVQRGPGLPAAAGLGRPGLPADGADRAGLPAVVLHPAVVTDQHDGDHADDRRARVRPVSPAGNLAILDDRAGRGAATGTRSSLAIDVDTVTQIAPCCRVRGRLARRPYNRVELPTILAGYITTVGCGARLPWICPNDPIHQPAGWPVAERRHDVTYPYPPSPGFAPVQPLAPVDIPSGAARPRLTFLGTGYLGATYAICFAELGYEVLGFDVDEAKIAKLAAGEVPIHEPGLDELLRRNLAAGRLRFSTDYQETAEFGDVHFICVGTPQRARRHGRRPDLRRDGGHLARPAPDPQGADRRQVDRPGRHRRVGRAAGRTSTPRPSSASRSPGARSSCRRASPSRTCCAPTGSCSASRARGRTRMLLAAHKGVFDLAVDRGPRGPGGGHRLRHRRAGQGRPRTPSSPPRSPSSTRWPRSARPPAATSPSSPGRSATTTAIGKKFLRAGVGFGGACLPKDIRAFQARAQELGVGEALRFLHEVDLINQRRRGRVVQLAAELLGRPYGPAGPDLTGAADRRARRDLQAQHRRRARLPGAGGRPRAGPGRRRRAASTTRRAWRTPAASCPTSSTPTA